MADPKTIEDFADDTWDAQVLRALPSGIDVSILEERLRLTPTQRLERMIAMLQLIEESRRAM